jgi:hypothetical protein
LQNCKRIEWPRTDVLENLKNVSRSLEAQSWPRRFIFPCGRDRRREKVHTPSGQEHSAPAFMDLHLLHGAISFRLSDQTTTPYPLLEKEGDCRRQPPSVPSIKSWSLPALGTVGISGKRFEPPAPPHSVEHVLTGFFWGHNSFMAILVAR